MLIYLFFAFLYGEKTDSQSVVMTGITTEWKGITDDAYIYIGTIDGFFHCINILTGEILWSVDTEGCIFGSTETEKRTFIPSLDGYLFTYFNNFGFKRIPLPIRDLVFMSPFKTENGEIFASEKSTSIFFINESGKVTLTYHSNSTIPLKSDFPIKDPDCLVVVRTNYLLNVIDNTSKIIKFAEFDIFTGQSQSDAQQTIKVTTTFSGSVIIIVNDTVTANFQINGVPTSVYGSFGKFEFKMNIDEEQSNADNSENIFITDSMAVFVELEGNSIAIPSRPFSPYETVATETEAQRSVSTVEDAKQGQNQHMTNLNRYQFIMSLPYNEIPFGDAYSRSECVGTNGKLFPCVVVSTQSKSTTQSLTDDKLSVETIVTTTFTLRPLFFIENYPFIACILFLSFVILNSFKYITENHQKNLISPIILDENDKFVGYFNDVKCSILTTSTVDETILKGLSELNVQHTVQIRTFEKISSLNGNNEYRIAYQPLTRFSFNNIKIRQKPIKQSVKIKYRNDKNYYNNNNNNDDDDEIYFEIDDSSQKQIQSYLAKMMNALSTLFKNGYVHGDINENCIFTDFDDEPLLGGFEKKSHLSKNLEEHEDDVSSVAFALYHIIEQKYNEKAKAETTDLEISKKLISSFDPILYDLLEEMILPDFNERPTAEEVLSHPFFFTTSQKMKLLSRCKEFLKKKKNSHIYASFNEKSLWISGPNWTNFVDNRLLQEAKHHCTYNGELTSDLVFFIRNKWEHPGFMSNGHKLVDDQYFNYFHKLFPNLFLYIYYFLDRFDLGQP